MIEIQGFIDDLITRGPVATPAGHMSLPTHREVYGRCFRISAPWVSLPFSAPVRLAACLHSTPPRVSNMLHALSSLPTGKSPRETRGLRGR